MHYPFSSATQFNFFVQETCVTMRLFKFLFSFGVVLLANSETCPSDEKLHPCTCRESPYFAKIEVTCYGNGILTLEELQQSLNFLEGKTDVQIYLNNVILGKVPSNFFKGIGVTKLEVWHCNLESLADENQPILAGLEESLEVIHIHESFNNSDNSVQLKVEHLTKLKQFFLSGNIIKEINNNWFAKGPISLKEIFIYDNKFEEVGDKVFANLPNLKTINLNGNAIKHIKRSMFPSPADYLVEIDLRYNALENLPKDMFDDMPKLYLVSLPLNGISKLDQDTWESIWEHVHTVELNRNPLVCDSHLEWTFDLRMPFTLEGTCDSPVAKRGTLLKDFIKNKGL